jgi:hypothetical protein
MTDDKFKTVPLASIEASPVPNSLCAVDKLTYGDGSLRFQPIAS